MVQSCVVVNHLLVEIVSVLFATSLACCDVQRCHPPKSSAAPIGKVKTKPCHEFALTRKAACWRFKSTRR